jgi:phosphoglycerate dehydrogenase-like enzyme
VIKNPEQSPPKSRTPLSDGTHDPSTLNGDGDNANGAAAPRQETRLIKAALFGDVGPAGETIDEVFGPEGLARLQSMTDLYPTIVTSRNIEACLPELEDLTVIFATWGMIHLTGEVLSRLPRLKALFYAAGSVRYFAAPLLQRGIVVTSSAAANAVPVAEFTLGQILLANKGYFRNVREYRETANFDDGFIGRGNYGATVSILGAGQIGRKVINLLGAFDLRLLVFDPYLSVSEAASLGVEKVDIETAFAHGDVVSNHLADLPATEGMLNGALFSSMPPEATFINTGRGRTVKTDDFLSVFGARPDLTALLDVTHPEKLPRDSPLWALPNVYISSHIAGAKRDEVCRVAEFAIEEFERWRRGEPLRHAMTLQSLGRVA